MIGDPPFENGADHDTVALPLPATALGPTGGPGRDDGVIGDVALEAMESPLAFVAITLKVYDTPLVKPVTVHESVPLVVQRAPPGFAVTV